MKSEEILQKLFSICEENKASDIHISTGEIPRMRIQGVLAAVDGFSPLTAAECGEIGISLSATVIADGSGSAVDFARSRLLSEGSIDGATTSSSGWRYRFNVYRENSATAIALRRLDDSFLPLCDLGLPPELETFCGYPDGLVVVTGPTGSGKSTTLATLIDMINRNRECHIITIEDPVEYIHKSARSLVHQRQVGRDAASFNTALVDSLRQDPDVILVGEIREIETIRTAITAAETGHLVFTTLHAGDCVGAIERLVSVFPEGEQDGIRHQLSLVLRGVFAQHLLSPAEKGARRVACGELLKVTTGVANLISTGRARQIYSAIETGGATGMVTLDRQLARLLAEGKITEATAAAMSRSPRVMKGWSFSGTGKAAL